MARETENALVVAHPRASLVEHRWAAGIVSAKRDIEDEVLRREELRDVAPAVRPVRGGRSQCARVDGARVPAERAGHRRSREEPDADTRARVLRDEHPSPGRRKPGAIRRGRGVRNDAALVTVLLVGAVRAVHDRGGFGGGDLRAAGLGVQGHGVLDELVDAFEGVDFAARGPVGGLGPECGPGWVATSAVFRGWGRGKGTHHTEQP